MVQMSKVSLRKTYKQIREGLSSNEVKKLSALINKNLLKQSEYQAASNIGSYYSIKNEVIVNIDVDKSFFYPKISRNKLNFFSDSGTFTFNHFGIKEPANSEQIQLDNVDLFLVPLIAFNEKLFRIGYGGGFYYQTFANLLGSKKRPLLIGLGYDCLKSELNFQTQKDVRLDKIITEKGVYV